MKEKIFFTVITILTLISCKKSIHNNNQDEDYLKYKNIKTKSKKALGIPYTAILDENSEKALAYVKEIIEDLGELNSYKRQLVNGINYYFVFEKKQEYLVEIVVHQNFKGDFKIISKDVVE